jgi:hypothetical protein
LSVPVLAVAPARALSLLPLFQSSEAKVFWQLAEEGAVLSLQVTAGAARRAVQGPPQPGVWALDSVRRAVWESEQCLVSPPMAPTFVEAPTWAGATED